MATRRWLLLPVLLLGLVASPNMAQVSDFTPAQQVELDRAKITMLVPEVRGLRAQVKLVRGQIRDAQATTQPSGWSKSPDAVWPKNKVVDDPIPTPPGDKASSDGPIPTVELVDLNRTYIQDLGVRRDALEKVLATLKAQYAVLHPPAATQPAAASNDLGMEDDQAAADKKSLHRVSDLLRQMPDDVKPKEPERWSDTRIAKVKAWLNQEAPGKPFYDENIRIAKVVVDVNPAHKDDASQPAWMASFVFYPRTNGYFGTHIVEGIQGVGAFGVAVTGDRELLHAYDQARGAYVSIRGVIDQITIDSLNNDDARMTVHLREFQLGPIVYLHEQTTVMSGGGGGGIKMPHAK